MSRYERWTLAAVIMVMLSAIAGSQSTGVVGGSAPATVSSVIVPPVSERSSLTFWYNKSVPAAVLAVLAGTDHHHVRSMTMAEASIAPILLEAKVAQEIASKEYLNRYACPMCGKEKVTRASHAKSHPLCVACSRIDCGLKRFVHGFTRHPLYDKWRGMNRRCYNTSDPSYHDYGLRGITVCAEWRYKPLHFIKWGLENGWRKGLQIDRIDVNGPYEPSNCRFVTAQINSQNKRSTTLTPDIVRAVRMLCWSGVPQTETAQIIGIHKSAVSQIMRFKQWSNV